MILVTGGTGAIGHQLVKELVAKGKRVRVLTLHTDPLVYKVCDIAEVVYGDITDAHSLQRACTGVSTVYHLAAIILTSDDQKFTAINTEGTRNLLAESKKAGVKHFIYVSSASTVYQKPTAYAISKRAAEDAVINGGIAFTIVRPTLVYDHDGGQEFLLFLAYLKKFPIVPFIGNGHSRKRPVYVGDLIAGLGAICDNKAAHGKMYNLSGGETISMRNFARLCLRILGMNRKPIVFIPVWICTAAADFFAKRSKQPLLTRQTIAGFTENADLDPQDAIRDLGYAPKKVSDQLPLCFNHNH